MKYSHRVSDAIHILVYIDIFATGDLASSTVAKSINANPSLVRRLMSQLREGELLISHQGISRPSLARPLNQITVFDVYKAVDANSMFLHIDTNTNDDCLVGGNIQTVLLAKYQDIQHAAEEQMTKITLDTIVSDILASANKMSNNK